MVRIHPVSQGEKRLERLRIFFALDNHASPHLSHGLMSKNKNAKGFLSQDVIALQEECFSVLFWPILCGILTALLVVIKYYQYGWASPLGLSEGGWFLAFRHRIDDVSFLLLLVGCITGFCLWWPLRHMVDAGLIPEGKTTLQRKHLAWLVLLVFVNWGTYFQAIYRDGGTFMWSYGDGTEAVATKWADRMNSSAEERNKIGPIFRMSKIGELSDEERAELVSLRNKWNDLDFIRFNPSDQDRFIELSRKDGHGFYKEVSERTKQEFSAEAHNAKKIAGLQALEGMIFLFVLTLWAMLGILLNIYVSHLGESSPLQCDPEKVKPTAQPKKDKAEIDKFRHKVAACKMLFRVCLIPSVLLGAFAGLRIGTDWKSGIVDAFLAGGSALTLWIPVIVAISRILLNWGPVIPLPFVDGGKEEAQKAEDDST